MTNEPTNDMHEIALQQSKFIDELLETLRLMNERLESLESK